MSQLELAYERMSKAFRNAQNLCINPNDSNAQFWWSIYLDAKKEYFSLSDALITSKRPNDEEVVS